MIFVSTHKGKNNDMNNNYIYHIYRTGIIIIILIIKVSIIIVLFRSKRIELTISPACIPLINNIFIFLALAILYCKGKIFQTEKFLKYLLFFFYHYIWLMDFNELNNTFKELLKMRKSGRYKK